MRHVVLTSVSSILLVVALVFLILATVSTPVATSLKLASNQSYSYGIFGFCQDSDCRSATYPVLFGSTDSGADWLFGEGTRNTLAKTFVVAPIAAGLTFLALVFTLLSLCLTASAVKILSLVFTVVAFFASALIAVMVILVFHPHVEWLGWLLIASAACCLLVVPLLLFSITVREEDEADSDTDAGQGLKFGDISRMDSHTVYSQNSFKDIKVQPQPGTSFNQTPAVHTFNYRGASTNKYSNQADLLNNSLLDSTPKMANDMTAPRPNMAGVSNGATSYAAGHSNYKGLSLQNGPSTPIAATRQFAPNYVPSEGTAATMEQLATRAPYPLQDSTSSIYDLRNYGVFDHHPSVEGHQPFTELEESDLVEKNSLSLDLPLDSDGESDFTSVSQRPPNEMYATPQVQQTHPHYQQHQQHQQHQYQQNYHPGMQYQAMPLPPGAYTQRPPQNFGGSPVQNHGQNPNQGYGPPGQYDRYQPQFQRQMNRPTVSDNALNNNPDFAIGVAGRRKQMGRPGVPMQRPNGSVNSFGARSGQRDGPYGNM